MIEAHQLTRTYGPKTAVEDLSFSVGEGEILGLLGPNGAGKTTTLRMVIGLLPPTAGRVTVAGYDLAEEPLAARRAMGYLPENVALYPEMRVREYLHYRARLHGLDRATAKKGIERALDRCLIADVAGQTIGTLSKGYRQRVGLAQAILHEPRVLVLDEPTVGLDPKQIIAIRELIRELGEERTLLLSSHILPEVELLCQRVLIIDRGRVVGQGTPEELRTRLHGHALLRVELEGSPAGAAAALAALPEVESAAEHPSVPASLLVHGAEGADPRAAIFHAAVANGWVLLALEQERASLEDVFVRVTTREEARDMEEPGSVEAERLAVPEPEERIDQEESMESNADGEGEEER